LEEVSKDRGLGWVLRRWCRDLMVSLLETGQNRLAYELRVQVAVKRDVGQGRSVRVEVSQRSELLVESLGRQL
jgi:hypothetical protein